MKQKADDAYMLATVSKALEILDLFADGRDELSLTQIAEATQLPKSSIFRYLATLEKFHYVERDEKSERYRLGLKLLQLGALVASRLDLRNLAFPIMWQLRKTFGETINLAVPHVDKVVYIDVLESQDVIRMASPMGAEEYMYATALGKAILAQLPTASVEDRLTLPLKPLTEYTITDMCKLLAELEQIREKGYAIDDREGNLQVRCIAAAIRDYRGQVVAAISVSGPENRLSIERAHIIGPELAQAGNKISSLLGYQPKSDPSNSS
jgi:DNA-binding IclR family transcriptional regulator